MGFKSYRTDAIVLSTRRYHEADSLLTLLTPDRGKVSAIAKGARKPTSKKAGKLQPFSHIEVQLYDGKTLQTVVQVNTRNIFPGLISSYEKFICSEVACELVSQVVLEGQKSKFTFYYLLNFLRYIEKADLFKAFIYTIAFELGMLYVLGVGLHLDDCVRCRSAASEENLVIDPSKGGIVCGRCEKGTFGISISWNDLLFLRALRDVFLRLQGKASSDKKDKTHRIKVSEGIILKTMNIIENFFLHQFDIEIKSNEYLSKSLISHIKKLR